MFIVMLTHNEEGVFYDEAAFHAIDNVYKIKSTTDTLTIVDDFSDPEYFSRLTTFCSERNIPIVQHAVNMDFAQHLNFLHSLAPKNEFFLRLDSDEYVDEKFFVEIQNKINNAPYPESFIFARNVVLYDYSKPYTPPEKIWPRELFYAYPDWQNRCYKLTDNIRFVGGVHSTIVGTTNPMHLDGEVFTIIHHQCLVKNELREKMYRKIGHAAYNK
jgi:hypothetical protein